MTENIELIKKWLANPASVTQKELDDNLTAATKQYYADAANATYAAVFYAANASYDAAYAATATAAWSNDAAYWVKLYEELKEKGE